MTEPNDVERRLVDWFDHRPDRMSEFALAEVVGRFATTPQRRAWPLIGRGRRIPAYALRLGLVGLLLAAIVAGAVVVGALIDRRPSEVPPATIGVGLLRQPVATSLGWLDDGLAATVSAEEGRLIEKAETVTPATSEEAVAELDGLAQRSDVVVTSVVSATDPLASAIPIAASAHPATTFIVFGDVEISAPNVGVVQWRQADGGYLAGILAAGMKDNGAPVGFLGGDAASSAVDEFERGFRAGVSSIDPTAGIVSERVGFVDTAGARAAMTRILDGGARIVFQAAGPAGVEAIAVADERGRLVIGVDEDQSSIASMAVLGSVRLHADLVLDRLLEAAAGHRLAPGIYEFGVADDAIDLYLNPALAASISSDTRDRIDHAVAAFRSGALRLETLP